MIITSFEGISVKGIAVAVPKNWGSIESLKNDENSDNLARFEKNTGIMGHFLADDLWLWCRSFLGNDRF